MAFSFLTPPPFRLRVLLTILAAGAAGVWLGYAGLRPALRACAEDSGRELLQARLELPAALLAAEAAAGRLAPDRALPAGAAAALEELRSSGAGLAVGRENAHSLLLLSPDRKAARAAGIRDPEAAVFLPALSGGTGSHSPARTGDKFLAWRQVPGTKWVLAAALPESDVRSQYAGVLRSARARSLLALALVAGLALLASARLTACLAETGRRAAALLEQCGEAPPAELREPAEIAAALERAAAALKRQSSRDIQLQSEAEKLREEEADLKSQNDELEKLTKYLMERESKISELKKEISELREKVGNGV